MNTAPATAHATNDDRNRKRNRVVLGAATAVIAAALVAGAGYWWQGRDELSQASAADCELARRIVTEAERISTASASEARKWWEETGDERRARMEDGYLGATISTYEGYALETARNPAAAPSAEELKVLQEKARGHCADAGITLSMPRLGS